MICPTRLSIALFSSMLLCVACTSDDAAVADDSDTEDPGTDGDAPVFYPPGARLIPAGQVWRGCLEGDDNCDSNEDPGGWVTVSSFFLYEHEVTVEDYEDCVDDDVCLETIDDPDCNATHGDRDEHPINCVSWDDANAYCAWRGLRLATEAEWERAARGDELTLYPWGDDTPSCTLAVIDDCPGSSTMVVGSAPDGDSPFGVADMTGNVSEWVSDYYDDGYFGDSPDAEDPQGPDSGGERVVKGSAFTVPGSFPAQRISKRNSSTVDSALRIYGIRCARDR